MINWASRRVLVAGGGGFLGTHVVEALRAKGCEDVRVVRSREYDLRCLEEARDVLEVNRPSIVIHVAGLVGGIGANKRRPADFFFDNILIDTHLMALSRACGVEKFITAGAGCGYPEHATMPLREEDFWNGYPQAESAAYSLARRMLTVHAKALYQQYGFKAVVCIPGNIYGPYDNFNLEDAHVIPALVRKFVEAVDEGRKTVMVWGTGRASRDFVYAGDVAAGMLRAGEVYGRPVLVNLSSGVETKIYDAVLGIANITGFEGKIIWDESKPDGQLRRCFSTQKAEMELGFVAQTSLRAGLEKTVEWYRANKETARR